MKKNRTMRVAALLLALTLITSCFVGGTMAKYTSDATGTSETVTVADWIIKIDSTNIVTADEFTFALFDTVKDTDGSAETDVTGTSIIAPGTQGSFDIKLKNESQVPAQYAIDYTVTNANNVPLQYSVDGGTTWTSDLEDVTASANTQLEPSNGEKTITVQWKWAFSTANNAGDAADTALGQSGSATVQVTAKVTATQVD